MTPLDAAIAWIQKGFSPVPIPHRSKRPVLKGWEQLEITIEAASAIFQRQVAEHRAASGGQVRKYRRRLRLPRSHYGRPRTAPGDRHDIREAVETVLTLLLSFRSAGPHRAVYRPAGPQHSCRIARVVIGWHNRVANSGPAKHPRDWRAGPIRARASKAHRQTSMRRCSYRRFSRVAAAALLARHWPTKGSRHHAFSGSGRRVRARGMERSKMPRRFTA